MPHTIRVANPGPYALALVNGGRSRSRKKGQSMAAKRNRKGRFTRGKSTARARPRARARARNRPRARHYNRAPVAAMPNRRRRRLRNRTTVFANRAHRRRRAYRNPGGGKGFLTGALYVGAGIAVTEFIMNYIPSINLGGALGPIVEELAVAYGVGWAARKVGLSPANADLMAYGGFGIAISNLLNTYVFQKIPALFQSSGTAPAVAAAAAAPVAVATTPTQGYFGDSTGMGDLVAFPNGAYNSTYYGAGTGLGAVVGFPRRWGR
jgi:hypothetical protein